MPHIATSRAVCGNRISMAGKTAARAKAKREIVKELHA